MEKHTEEFSLPILLHKRRILDALRFNRVIVVSGETGSGKTTQLPQFCLELEKKRLITTEWTMVRTKSGKAHNGTLKYTIRPIQEAIDYYEEIQMKRLYAEAARRRAEEALAKYDEKHRNRAV